MTEKKYKNFTIKKGTVPPSWCHVFKDGDLVGKTPDEDSARQLIWLRDGKGDPITDEMMEEVNA
jgi:hypothetical protein